MRRPRRGDAGGRCAPRSASSLRLEVDRRTAREVARSPRRGRLTACFPEPCPPESFLPERCRNGSTHLMSTSNNKPSVPVQSYSKLAGEYDSTRYVSPEMRLVEG